MKINNIVIFVSNHIVQYFICAIFYVQFAIAAATNEPPTISGVPPLKISVGTSFKFMPVANDPDGDTLTFSIANKPTWLQFNTATGELSGTPTTANVGLTTAGYTISVSDGKGGTAKLAAYNLLVQAGTNTAPVISGVPALKVNVGNLFSFTPVASDINNDRLTFSITNKPSWLTFDTTSGKLSGTPTIANIGLTPTGYVISVSDGKGGMAKLAAFNIRVDNAQIITNRPPVVSGTPATRVFVDAAYRFTPTASDPDNNLLSFTIANKPAWATFDPTNGTLSGTPTVAGIHQGIIISVSDGKEIVNLPAFNITVSAAAEIKLSSFGIASQSTTYGNIPASNALDGDTNTYNHANCQANDWWQVELKSNPNVSRIVITNRDNSGTAINRLSGATVYVSAVSAVNGVVNPAEQVATLTGVLVQTITVNPSRIGKFVIVRTSGSKCLHMAEVEVYGQGDSKPAFELSNYSFITDFDAALKGAAIGNVKGFDYQSDPLSFSVPANIPFSINAQGNLIAKSTLQPTIYNFTATVSDGVNSSTAQITVDATLNLARQFGLATQGSTAFGGAKNNPENALDGNLSTNSFTVCDGITNWWSVKLPTPNRINRVNFTIQPFWGCALNKAEVYLSDTPYQKPMDSNAKIGTLNCDNKQNLSFPAPVSGSYLIVKGSGENCMTFSEVEAYGEILQAAPQTDQASYDFLLASNSVAGDQVGVIKATDYQLNSISFVLQGGVPFTIDNQGIVRVNGAIAPKTVYSFNVSVSDGIQSTIVPVKVTTTAVDAVATAIATGDSAQVTADELLDAGIALAKNDFNYCTAELAKIYPTGLQQSTFPLRSAYTITRSARNIPLHVGATTGAPNVYSWLGARESGSRYAYLGTNVFAFSPNNTELRTSTLNLLRWLMGRDVSDNILNEPLTILIPNGEDRNILNTWFTDNGLTHKWTISADTALFVTGRFDLLIAETSRPVSYVKNAFSFNRPVLVFNQWYEPPAAMLQEFDLAWNWYGGQRVGNFASVVDQCRKSFTSSAIQTVLSNLKTGLPDFIYEPSDCPTDSAAKTVCVTDQVSDAVGKNTNGLALGSTVNTLFLDGTSMLRSLLKDLDSKGINLFSQNSGTNLLKIATLLADKYRLATHYPMDKVATDDNTFYKTMFADYLVHYSRPNNFYQPDLGPYTDNQAAMNALPTITKSVTLTPTGFSEWTSTGVYLPPGKTITVRRTDTGAAKVKLRSHMLRLTTRLWQTNGYNRPIFLSSNEIALDVGKTYTFSTPYGGPAYLNWDAMPNGGVPFTVEFNNVLDNPLLTKFDEASVSAFLDELKTNISQWVDIKTSYGELHSRKNLLYVGIDRSDFDTTNGFTVPDAIDYPINLNKYLFKGSYGLAGFTNPPELTLKPGVAAFCNRQGLNAVLYDGATTNLCTDKIIHRIPIVQHMNAEINSECGGLCSGNPIDFEGPIVPVGYGEGHELGHNLQVPRLSLYGSRTGEISNNIFGLFMFASYSTDKGLALAPKLTEPPNESAFNILQNAIKNGIGPGLGHPMWSSSDPGFPARLAFYGQLPYVSQTWDVYTKLYIMNRVLGDAVNSDAKWNAVKNLLGFGSYSLADAKALNANDFMFVALSVIEQKNYGDYFNAWGIEVSQAAKNQVTANGITTQVPARFFYVTPKTFPAAIPTFADSIPLDGVSAYLDPTP